jgi:predicted RNA binding protein YcfA (HicA-like mRNA interferase family)
LVQGLETYRQYYPHETLQTIPTDPDELLLRFTKLPKSAASELERAFDEDLQSSTDFRTAYAALLAKQQGTPLSESSAQAIERLARRLRSEGATVRNHPSRLRVVRTGSGPRPGRASGLAPPLTRHDRPAAPPPPASARRAVPELPREYRTADEISDWLRDHDFVNTRTRGSHQHWSRPGARSIVTVPLHGSADIKPGTLANIRRQIAAALEGSST